MNRFALAFRPDGVGATLCRPVRRNGVMNYSVYFDSANIAEIANGVKGVPLEFINVKGNGVTDKCVKYLAPLILGERVVGQVRREADLAAHAQQCYRGVDATRILKLTHQRLDAIDVG